MIKFFLLFLLFSYSLLSCGQVFKERKYSFSVEAGIYHPGIQGDISYIRSYNNGLVIGMGISKHYPSSRFILNLRSDFQYLKSRIALVYCDCPTDVLINSTSSLSLTLSYTALKKEKSKLNFGVGSNVFYDFNLSNTASEIQSDPGAVKKYKIFILYPIGALINVSAHTTFIRQIDKNLHIFTNLTISHGIANNRYPYIYALFNDIQSGFQYTKSIFYNTNNIYFTFGIIYDFSILWKITDE